LKEEPKHGTAAPWFEGAEGAADPENIYFSGDNSECAFF